MDTFSFNSSLILNKLPMSKITKYSKIANCDFTVRFVQAFRKLGLTTVNQAGLFLDRCQPDCKIDTTRAAILRTELHKFYEQHGLYGVK